MGKPLDLNHSCSPAGRGRCRWPPPDRAGWTSRRGGGRLPYWGFRWTRQAGPNPTAQGFDSDLEIMRNPRIPQAAILVRSRQPVRASGIPGVQTVLIGLNHPHGIAMDSRQRGGIQHATDIQQTVPGDPSRFGSKGEDPIKPVGLPRGGPGDGGPGFAEHCFHLPLKVALQSRVQHAGQRAGFCQSLPPIRSDRPVGGFGGGQISRQARRLDPHRPVGMLAQKIDQQPRDFVTVLVRQPVNGRRGARVGSTGAGPVPGARQLLRGRFDPLARLDLIGFQRLDGKRFGGRLIENGGHQVRVQRAARQNHCESLSDCHLWICLTLDR